MSDIPPNLSANQFSMTQSEEAASVPICPVCHNAKWTNFAFSRAGNTIFRCRLCKIEFSYPQPSGTKLTAIYNSGYFLGGEDKIATERVASLKRGTAKLYLDAITPFLTVGRPRLLEIGCGSGEFLAEANSRGFQVEGLEFSSHATQVANALLGYDAVRTGSLESTFVPTNTYDVIAAFDVIEHVRDPVHSLHRLYSALKPRGIAAIVTPSLDSWSRRLLGKYWMEYKTEHMTYFSQNSLRLALKDAGFDTILFRPNYKVLSLDYLARYFDRFPIGFISLAVRSLRRIAPSSLAHRKVEIVASGIMAIAKRGI